jgi:hypothetical protein
MNRAVLEFIDNPSDRVLAILGTSLLARDMPGHGIPASGRSLPSRFTTDHGG